MPAILGRPLLLKNGILCFSLRNLAAVLPTLRVVHVARDPVEVAGSILRMRERFWGERTAWWSVRPADADAVSGHSPEAQVAFQVRRTVAAIEAARKPGWIDIGYPALCADPRGTVAAIGAALGIELTNDALPRRFDLHRADPDPAIVAALAEPG